MRGVPRVRMLGSTQSAQMGAHTPSGARRIAIATGFHATPCTPRASADRPRPGRACGVAYLLVLFWEQKPGSHGTLSLFWVDKKNIQFTTPSANLRTAQTSRHCIRSNMAVKADIAWPYHRVELETIDRLPVSPSGDRNNSTLPLKPSARIAAFCMQRQRRLAKTIFIGADLPGQHIPIRY